MDSSREQSPDWLRSFQAPIHSVLTLSSDSESSPNDSPLREDRLNSKEPSPEETSQFPEKEEDHDVSHRGRGKDSLPNKTLKAKSPIKRPKARDTPVKKKRKTDNISGSGSAGNEESAKQEKSEKHIEPTAPNNSIWTLSSDSESPSNNPVRKDSKGKSPKNGMKTEDPVLPKKKRVNKDINRKGNTDEMGVAEEEIAEKQIEPRFSSSRLPLVLSEKVSRSKALVECEGESIDLSGDVGAVGRVIISDNSSRNHEMLFDLKGTIYKTTIVPSRTFCVVSFSPSEAKIEAIMNDFIQLKPQSNVDEAETMIEGTLDGYSFDSEDDAEKLPKAVTNQNEGGEEKSNQKPKTKADKTSGVVRKRGKATGGKPPKKVKKRTQAPKKSKSKK